jgi:pilus assembly protein TadC
MNISDIHFGVKLLGESAAVLTFALSLAMIRDYKSDQWVLRSWEGLKQGVQHSRFWDVSKSESFLMQYGAKYHLGAWIDPISYLALRLILLAVGMLIGSLVGMLYILPIGVVFCALPRIYVLYANIKDNEKLLPELKLVYHALAMQIRAGVYMTDALTECYGSVREVRFRDALLTLSGDLVMKADFGEALEHFQNKFNNRYIDSLCITLLQAQESGQAVDLLTDIAEQIKDMETALLARKKSALDRSITFYQLGVLAIVLAIVLFACITHMFSEITLF